jgi:hypothetical protein
MSGRELQDASIFLHWYERNEAKDQVRFSLLWLIPPDISLFHYRRDAAKVRHGFFPLYSYSYDREHDALSWSIFWFLFSYESKGEFASQTAFLWKVISYERQDAESYDFRFLWRVIRVSRSPTASSLEFNPFYYSEVEEGKGSYWAVLGGIVGRQTLPDGKKRLQLLWITW